MLNKYYIYVGWCVNLLEPRKIHQFTIDGFSGVKNFKYVCTEFLCCVCSVVSVSLWLFDGF